MSVLFIGVTLLSTAYADWNEGKKGTLNMTLGNFGDNHIAFICEPAEKQYTLMFKELGIPDTENSVDNNTHCR